MFIESSTRRKFAKVSVKLQVFFPAIDMKKLFTFLFILVAIFPCAAQQLTAPLPDVRTTWPDIHYQVFRIDRISQNRIVIEIKIYATSAAPQEGTFIGVNVPIPKNTDPKMIAAGMYRPDPFSLGSAVLTDDATNQTYQMVLPDPAGPTYYPWQTIATLHPNQARPMDIEFPCPPPPPLGPDGTAPKQTISILLPNAKGPLVHITLPPPATPAPTP